MRSPRALFHFAVLSLALTLSGCPLAPLGVAEGGRCVRSAQCNPGLVCSAIGTCTSDLTGFGTGMVPVVDAAGIDAGMPDAGDFDGGEPIDAPIIPMDTPIVPMDTPVVPMDTPMGIDAGMPDTGVDAGMPDAPVAEPDAPPDEPDAPVDDAG